MRRQKKFTVAFSLLVLAAGAIVLGFLILKTLTGSENKPPMEPQGEFTDDEKALLKTPQKDASETEKAAHFAIVQRLARATEFLDLSTCFGNPIVFRVQEGITFTVKNNDSVAHTLQISPEHIYTIPAKSEEKITAQFGFGPGVYGYGCDDSPDARGVLFVTQ